MGGLSGSELLLWGGVGAMAISAVGGVLCCFLFSLSGKKLKKRLEQEYGEMRH